MSTIFHLMTGAIITWIVAQIYYVENAMETQGWIKVKRDENGKVISYISMINLKGDISIPPPTISGKFSVNE